MTKSIEEQAEEFAIENRGYDFFKDQVPFAIDMKNCFLAGAKARDAQFLAVVSELREALKFYGSDSPSWQRLEHTNSIISDVDLIKPKTVLYKGQLSGGRTADESLAKADQMLKEMGMK